MNQQQSLEFIRQSNTLVTDALDRSKVVASAVAVALASAQDIPTSPVQDPAAFYINTISPRMRSQISAFNEGAVFDIRYSLDLARGLWLTRYFACHGVQTKMYKPENTFLENFTGAAQAVAPDIQALLNKYQAPIGLLATSVSTIMADLLKDGVV